MKSMPKVIIIIGPTASGKSDFAVEYALKHNGEVISADSRQIYKGLDIGTGKITTDEMKGIKHYMLDVCNPGDRFSVADYAHLALPILEEILVRGKTPIICGGTGQYVDALIYADTFPHVLPNEKLRKKLESKSTEELFNELEKVDIRRASSIDRHNRVRLIRALEIAGTLGKVPESSIKKLRYDIHMYLMCPTKEQLIEKIAKRLEKRLDAGMLEEARDLRSHAQKTTLADSQISSLGLEYKWMNNYLKNECTLEEMKQHILTDSWRYAKRQMTWNKKYESFAEKVSLHN